MTVVKKQFDAMVALYCLIFCIFAYQESFEPEKESFGHFLLEEEAKTRCFYFSDSFEWL